MYSIKKVSDILGIPVVTIRAWENRYRIIAPHRSEGGHRFFSEDDINKLKFLKQQIEQNGVKISEAVRMLRHSTSKENAGKKTVTSFTAGRAHEDMIDRLYEQLISYNTLKANEIIDLAFSLYDFEIVFSHILMPAMYRIGAEWECGKLSVLQEHFASQLIIQRFSQFFRVLPIDDRLPRMLAFCPEGEYHQIGLMHFCIFLKKKGVDVIYLGPSTPLDGLPQLIGMKKISFVTVSVTDSQHLEALTDWIETTLLEMPHLGFVLGGPAFATGKRPLPNPNIYYPDDGDWEDWYQCAVHKG
ncbi:MerR family transcriptional regulator [Cohnella endophytica]|uniref:MerR family transcriptional regulator n=1 Tax=Cohnella endophytica TaxID=2419778 RepID=A0A494XLR9_9BACL|nr:MerR family transcriptional regulator [Cohnella endophytica]RKP51558.1 MerR family transcriptional regulator [Cohnella endophytica]